MKEDATTINLNEILAVLVLYRCDLTDTKTFISLTRSLQRRESSLNLFVYDNSPSLCTMVQGEDNGWRIHYHHDPTNPGVSKAYNEGAKRARALGKKWLLLLDQDTVFPEAALEIYCEAVNSNSEVAVFAPVLNAGDMICSPCRYFARTGFPLKKVVPGQQQYKGRAVVNSGMLVRLDVFERSGGFDERIRLDFADFAFNNRLRRICDSFYVLNLHCRHGFSGTETQSLEEALQRFGLFCEGAAHAANGFFDGIFYRLVVLRRLLRLTIHYRTYDFLLIGWRFIFNWQ